MRRTFAAAVTAAVLSILLGACGVIGSSGNSPATSQGAQSASGHRVGHDSDYTYPGGNSSNHQTLPGAPEVDYPGLHELWCSTHPTVGTPTTPITIHNTSSSTNDYSIEVDFFPGTHEANVGSELARTFVQVYAVKPGETVHVSTAELFGQQHMLNAPNFCVPTVIQRHTSGATSAISTPTPTGACNLLTTDELQKVAGVPIRPDQTGGANTTTCRWTDANNTFSLLLVQAKPAAPARYTQKFPAPCTGSYGYQEGSLVAICTGGKSGLPYYITYGNPAVENQLPATNPYSPTLVQGISHLISLAMARA